MRISIDIDGVLTDFTSEFSSIACSLGLIDKPFSGENQHHWNYNFPMEPCWDVIKNTYNWWMTLAPIISPEEIAMLNGLIENHDVYFITARKQTKGLSAETQTRHWLSSIGVLVEHATVIATQEGKKGVLCSALDIDIAIDDKPEGVWEIMEQGVYCITRRWPYNDGDRLMDYVDSLGKFIKYYCKP